MRPRLLLVVTVLFAAAVPLRSAVGQTAFSLVPTWVYDFSTIVVPGADNTLVEAINNKNEIAGVFVDRQVGHSFVVSGGALTTFEAPDANTTVPLDMNDNGTIVGFFQRSGVIHGFQYANGTLSISPYGETSILTQENHPTSINNQGHIVGWASWGVPFVCCPSYFTYFDSNNFNGPDSGGSGL